MSSPRLRRPKKPGGASNYVALAGEFYVLAELNLRSLDATPTLGHTKEIDILLSNRQMKRPFWVEVKTTRMGVERSKIFGEQYAWPMNEKHGEITDVNLVYCFVLLGRPSLGPTKPRFFLVPAREVASYIRWEYKRWLRHAKRRTGKPSRLRKFRIPTGNAETVVPPSWRAGRWKRYEENWRIFGPSPAR